MNVFFEEDKELKMGVILSRTDSHLMVESLHGKRLKLKVNQVWFTFEQGNPALILEDAKRVRSEIDIHLLWEASHEQMEWDIASLAKEYWGRTPAIAEQIAMAYEVQEHPIYFYRKGGGHFRPAQTESLQAALLGLERKAEQDRQRQMALALFQQGEIPDWIAKELPDLVYQADKNTHPWKTLEWVAEQMHRTVPQLVFGHKDQGGARAWHEGLFAFEYFTHWPVCSYTTPLELSEWPLAEGFAFSLDDRSTTEIDDAFSLKALSTGEWLVGIHIAAPALGIEPNSQWDGMAQERLSTVYFPGNKITMLPQEVIQPYSLTAGAVYPVLSLYLTVSADLSTITTRQSLIERIYIQTNLRLEEWEGFDPQSATSNSHGRELAILWQVAQLLAKSRGVFERPPVHYQDYQFQVDGEHINIIPRPRGSPLDELVSELMIEVNREWATQLSVAKIPALFRTQTQGRTKLSFESGPHEGMGLNHYAWCSSPIRRYADLFNQWQLIRLFQGQPTLPKNHGKNDSGDILQRFERAYDAYQDFQRTMERYWCLRFLEQENRTVVTGLVIRDELIRLNDLPLTVKIPDLKGESRTEVVIKLLSLDLWTLESRWVLF